MRRVIVLGALGVFVLLGIIVPRIFIPNVQAETDDTTRYAPKYALVRMDNMGGLFQRLLRVKTSVVEVEHDPAGCDWGYREPTTGIVTIRAYTLWGLSLETWRMTCNSEDLISSLF